MKRLYLLVEGQTEETFVEELLKPHYAPFSLFIEPILVSTSPGHKGGIVSYAKIKPQITRLCRQDRSASVSTMFDLYALPKDFPGKQNEAYPHNGRGSQKATFIENCLNTSINESNFIPHLMVHEFEALLFTEPHHFRAWTKIEVVKQLMAISTRHDTPEDINDQPSTSPSKRILSAMPAYQKTFHGPIIAADIGLNSLRRSCPHFNEWLLTLEQLSAI